MKRAASPETIAVVYRAVVAIPELGIEPGDDVVLQPDAPRRLTLCTAVDQSGFYHAVEARSLVAIGGAAPGPQGAALLALLPEVVAPRGLITRRLSSTRSLTLVGAR